MSRSIVDLGYTAFATRIRVVRSHKFIQIERDDWCSTLTAHIKQRMRAGIDLQELLSMDAEEDRFPADEPPADSEGSTTPPGGSPSSRPPSGGSMQDDGATEPPPTDASGPSPAAATVGSDPETWATTISPFSGSDFPNEPPKAVPDSLSPLAEPSSLASASPFDGSLADDDESGSPFSSNAATPSSAIPNPNSPPQEANPTEFPFESSSSDRQLLDDRKSPARPATASTYPADSTAMPEKIGRFEVVRLLGRGGFGEVYLGRDPFLGRLVALKIPRLTHSASADEQSRFLEEARKLVNIQGPGIVIVYEVFAVTRADVPSVCIVQQFIDGTNLADWRMAQTVQISPDRVARLVIDIAMILSSVHRQGLLHRDLKPANIILDQDGRPYVLDFGLAIQDDQRVDRKGVVEGTLPYMSPEQTLGETHRMDDRSDIWSLGVIFYELLTGQRPFRSDNKDDLFTAIQTWDPRPPRQVNEGIPPILERICLKCLRKLRQDRYTTMADLANELRRYRDSTLVAATANAVEDSIVSNSASAPQKAPNPLPSSPQSTQVIPRGLRSYGKEDAGFFLELLPGFRESNGLPTSIDFWKRRIESPLPDQLVPVGVVAGPSGCGKTSLIKAGLLPRLASHVKPLYLESTQDDTERQLLALLHASIPALPLEIKLADALRGIRKGRWIPLGSKVLIVIDQFEQWLYGHQEVLSSELLDGLRQCDGQRLQAIIMVRDDFFCPTFDFMRQLDIDLSDNKNTLLVKLFDQGHAKKVLALFGHAYGRLPRDPGNFTLEQNAFLDAAVASLSDAGKVVGVRLTVFAELMRDRPWTIESFAAVGGAEGVGVAFLEDSFSARDASPVRKRHAKAAKRVLKALLPPHGIQLRGHSRSDRELMLAAEYSSRPTDYAELTRILDDELRLVTVVCEMDGTNIGIQLTHDFLVPSIRTWLALGQGDTARGRAELRLEERTSAWMGKPENRQLPSLTEYLRIVMLTSGKTWTEPQRRMMRRAGKVHGFIATFAVIIIALACMLGFAAREWLRIGSLIGQLIVANPEQVLEIAQQLDKSPFFADAHLDIQHLRRVAATSHSDAIVNVQIAQVGRDPGVVPALTEFLLSGRYSYIVPIRERFRSLPEDEFRAVTAVLRNRLLDDRSEPRRRFSAALALASYELPDKSSLWTDKELSFIAKELTSANLERQAELRRALHPLADRLRGPIEDIFRDTNANDAYRLGAAYALAEYAAKDSAKLADLLTVATAEQFLVLFPVVEAGLDEPVRGKAVIDFLQQTAATLPPADLAPLERVAFGRRRANAAVTLLRLGELERTISVFSLQDDPEAISQFIFRCRPRGVGVESLLDCLEIVSSAPQSKYPMESRQSLILALGEFEMSDIPEERREHSLAKIRYWYENEPSSGIHGAASWLLRKWGDAAFVKKIDSTPLAYSRNREWFTLAVNFKPRQDSRLPSDRTEVGSETRAKESQSNVFYYNFVVFPSGPYSIGSLDGGDDVKDREPIQRLQFTRRFAVLNREITFAEMIAFSPEKYKEFMERILSKSESPAGGVNWYDAVAFCRWLGVQAGLPESEQAYADPNAPSNGPRETYPNEESFPRDWQLSLGKSGFRLPTEAEWETACRSGVRTAYGFGGDQRLLQEFGWYGENSGRRTHLSQQRRPNLRGIFDMHGNQLEWTHDWFNDYESDSVIDPLGGSIANDRVHRGGSWGGDTFSCRADVRESFPQFYRSEGSGFRIALSIAPTDYEASDKKK